MHVAEWQESKQSPVAYCQTDYMKTLECSSKAAKCYANPPVYRYTGAIATAAVAVAVAVATTQCKHSRSTN